MESSLGPLLPLFERERAAGRPLVLGVTLETAGSTYRKPGALLLIASDGEYAGLLSGGCLEGDLREHAALVREAGEPRVIGYDLRGPDDLLWGLGLGCEGAMQVLLLRCWAGNGWQPLEHLAKSLAEHRATAVGLVAESTLPSLPAGTVLLPGAAHAAGAVLPALQAALAERARSRRTGWLEAPAPGVRVFALPLALPPRILLLGAGPDTLPVVDFAARLGWKVTLADHRPAYAHAARFPAAERVLLVRPEECSQQLDLGGFAAAVVMSHHLHSDLAYLRALARSTIPYVGLLGPAIRREKLLAELGPQSEPLRSRLRAPVGLALGGRAPESIALAIISEIHAFLHDAPGQPFSQLT